MLLDVNNLIKRTGAPDMQYKISDDVESPYGTGVVVAIEEHRGVIRYGVRHEVYTCEKPPKDYIVYLEGGKLSKLR